ncbi:hypothetical protein EST38_g14312 [Candolleomyces aberdarensis]|uniref:Uncharacterized protein n=1 Tax=Candolleomyces aberdarensis TaxID=2316362 RepID=A0A4Q2CYR6_9AGAR|nr:hypothetical protein EST38_g14312 [Candolleomyces aberdarensis]
MVLTSLIAFRLVRARSIFSELLPSADMRHYTGVVAILIESALPLGLITVILQQNGKPRTSLSAGYSVCGALFYLFCSLSPHMIVFRVTTGRSFTKFPSGKDGVLSNPLQFADHAAESTFLQSGLNREFGGNRDQVAASGSPEGRDGSGDMEKAD